MKLFEPRPIFIISFLILSVLFSCHSDKSEPKLNKLNDKATTNEDSLINVITGLRKEMRELKSDTAEVHTLIRDYENLKNEYYNFRLKISKLNIEDNSFAAEFKNLQDESEVLETKFKNLNKENSRFKVLASANRGLQNENLDINKKYSDLLKENKDLKNTSNSESNRMRKELSLQIDSLKSALKVAKDSMNEANVNINIANEKITAIQTQLNHKQAELDSLPDIEPSFYLEYLPHNTKGFLKPKFVKMDAKSNISKKNLGIVRVNINATKIKSEAKGIVVFIEYLVTYKTKGITQSEIFNPKSVTIQKEAITFSDSVTIIPMESTYKDFEIYSRNLPKADHEIKIFYKTCDLNNPQKISFSTY